jgi:SPX domain protein involved in polyphosphate accumulation
LYQSTVNSEKNRYKLRLRYYSDNPDAPVFFEIKRRVDSAILKQRGGVRREAVEDLLAGQLPAPEHLVSKDPKHLVALQRFCELMNRLEAKPKVHVAYLREAWLPHDNNSVRVTMDRQVRDDPEPTARLSCQMKNPVLVFGESVILEIKFTGRFPQWLADLVRSFNLRQCSAAKYVDGICRMGEKWGGGFSSEFVSKLLGAAAASRAGLLRMAP